MSAPVTREWGARFWDGTVRAWASGEDAHDFAKGFKPGCVEVVARDGADELWQRAEDQPHTLEERFQALFDARREAEELSAWRGGKLADLGLSPNPWSWGEPEHALLFQEKRIKTLLQRIEELERRSGP